MSGGLFRCKSCGRNLPSTEFGRLGGSLNPSCLVCRRKIRNASYKRRKDKPKPEPIREPVLYQLVSALDKAAKLDLAAGVSFPLVLVNGGAESGMLVIWRPEFPFQDGLFAPVCLLVQFQGQVYLLSLEDGLRPAASFLVSLGLSLGEVEGQTSAPPTIMPGVRVINSRGNGKAARLDLIENGFVHTGSGLEYLSSVHRVAPAIIALLGKTLGWAEKRAEIDRCQRETAAIRMSRTYAIRRAIVESKEQEGTASNNGGIVK